MLTIRHKTANSNQFALHLVIRISFGKDRTIYSDRMKVLQITNSWFWDWSHSVHVMWKERRSFENELIARTKHTSLRKRGNKKNGVHSAHRNRQLTLMVWKRKYVLCFILFFFIISFYSDYRRFNGDVDTMNRIKMGRDSWLNSEHKYRPAMRKIARARPRLVDRLTFMDVIVCTTDSHM